MSSSVQQTAAKDDFRSLWFGQTLALLGTQVALLALPLTAVTILQASAFEVGVMQALEFSPYIVMSLFVGRWLDGRRRRDAMVMSNTVRALLVGLVPLAAAASLLSIHLLWAVALLVGATGLVFQLAYQSYVPSLVGRAGLLGANSRLEISNSLAQIAGPGLGGALVGAISAPLALAATAVCTAVAALSISRIEAAEPPPARAAGLGLSEALADLKLVLGHPHLRAMAIESALYNLFFQGNYTLLVLHATRTLGLGPAAIAAVFAGASVSGIAGSMTAAPLARRIGLGRAATLGCALACIGPLGILLAVPGDAIPALLLAQIVTGFGLGTSNIHFTSLRQAATPDNRLGGMQGAYRFVTWGPIPLGALAAGMLAQQFGSWSALAVMASALSTVWLVLLPSSVSRLRSLPLTDHGCHEDGAK